MEPELTSVQIFKLLPKTDCRDCGFSTCKSFAAKVATGQAKLDACPHFSYKEISGNMTSGSIGAINQSNPIDTIGTNEQEKNTTLIDHYRDDYEKALNSIEVDVKKMIVDGNDMKGLVLLQENIGKIIEIHDSLDDFYKLIYTWKEVLYHFNSERIRQLGHQPVMLCSKLSELLPGHELEHAETVVMGDLKKLGFNRKHWLLKSCLLNETEYLLEVLQILIEPEFIPLEQDSEEKTNRYIPSKVKTAVWRRDNGRCVDCGSQEKLEYDHIIPVSKGGSNTERNIQLLCEKCNRKKSATIQ